MRRLPTLLTAATALALPALGTAAPSTTIGTGVKSCVLAPGADCRGVVHRWGVEHHGNLRKAKFTKADLRGADLRGADLRGAKLRHADLRGARLKGARFDTRAKPGKRANATPSCAPNCGGADLYKANLTSANLYKANLWDADLTRANLTSANLTNADLTEAFVEFVTWSNTTCPNGNVQSFVCAAGES